MQLRNKSAPPASLSARGRPPPAAMNKTAAAARERVLEVFTKFLAPHERTASKKKSKGRKLLQKYREMGKHRGDISPLLQCFGQAEVEVALQQLLEDGGFSSDQKPLARCPPLPRLSKAERRAAVAAAAAAAEDTVVVDSSEEGGGEPPKQQQPQKPLLKPESPKYLPDQPVFSKLTLPMKPPVATWAPLSQTPVPQFPAGMLHEQ